MTRKLVHQGVGRRIAEVRKRLGLKRYQFAEKLGVTRATVGNYERGQMPRADVLDKIARLGEVTVEWLLHGGQSKGGGRTPELPSVNTSSLKPFQNLLTRLQPALVPERLAELPPPYRRRYHKRVKELVARVERELEEYRKVLEAEHRSDRAKHKDET